jgi:hypothetical protein
MVLLPLTAYLEVPRERRYPGGSLTLTALEGHAAIPIAFVVDRILTVTLIDDDLGGMSLTETVVDDPYVKDYDVTRRAGLPARPV